MEIARLLHSDWNSSEGHFRTSHQIQSDITEYAQFTMYAKRTRLYLIQLIIIKLINLLSNESQEREKFIFRQNDWKVSNDR